MGCSECGRKGGCSVRKGHEAELLGEPLAGLYPARRWGEPDDAARFRGGVGERAGRRLARRAAEALQARTYFRPGDEDELCDYIYVLCVGREPGVYELREQGAIELPDGDRIRERYLRAALSHVAKVASLQEVAFELTRQGDVYLIEERPRDGVYDPILLKRTRRFVDLLVHSGLDYLDFGLLTKPASRFVEGFADDAYREAYGQPAGVVNYLFYPQPPTAVATCYVPVASG